MMAAVPHDARRYPPRGLEVIVTLTGSLVHRVAAELVHRHHNAGNGRCACCGQPSPCAVRQSAAWTCLFAGDDPEALRSDVALPLTRSRDVHDFTGPP